MLQKAYVHILFFLVQWRRLTFCGEKCSLVSYYAACRRNSLPTFWDNLSVTSSSVNNSWNLALYSVGLGVYFSDYLYT